MTLVVLFITLIFAAVVTPTVRRVALRLNFVAVPRKDRAHQTVTPLMGGVALYIGLSAAVVVLSLGVALVSKETDLESGWSLRELYIVLAIGTILAIVGLWDDWRPLSPKVKAVCQAVPVLILPLTTSVEIRLSNLPNSLNFVLTLVWFMYLINAFNYLDNMDGIAAITATVAGTFFSVIAVINEQFLVAALAAMIAGTSFGFLRFNLFEPNKAIFMGDVGTLFLGYLLAVIGVKLIFAAESPWITWPVPVLVLGVPIFDTALVFISRMRRGQSFLQGGTDHLSHRLSRLGFGRYGVPFAIGLIGAGLGCTAILVMHSTLFNSFATQLAVAGIAIYMMYKLEFSATYEFITGKPRPQKEEMVTDNTTVPVSS